MATSESYRLDAPSAGVPQKNEQWKRIRFDSEPGNRIAVANRAFVCNSLRGCRGWGWGGDSKIRSAATLAISLRKQSANRIIVGELHLSAPGLSLCSAPRASGIRPAVGRIFFSPLSCTFPSARDQLLLCRTSHASTSREMR